MVVNGDRQGLLYLVLADHVLIEIVLDLAARAPRRSRRHGAHAAGVLAEDVLAQLGAVRADVDLAGALRPSGRRRGWSCRRREQVVTLAPGSLNRRPPPPWEFAGGLNRRSWAFAMRSFSSAKTEVFCTDGRGMGVYRPAAILRSLSTPHPGSGELVETEYRRQRSSGGPRSRLQRNSPAALRTRTLAPVHRVSFGPSHRSPRPSAHIDNSINDTN